MATKNNDEEEEGTTKNAKGTTSLHLNPEEVTLTERYEMKTKQKTQEQPKPTTTTAAATHEIIT